MKSTTSLPLFLFVTLNSFAQKRAYKIYNTKEKKVSYNRVLKKLAKDENPNLNYSTIITVLQKDINKLEKESRKKADFIISINDNITTIH